MQPRLREVLDYLDARHAELQRAVESVPRALRERRPAPDRWSVAEVVEHLAVVEGQLAWLLAHLVEAARALDVDPARDAAPVLPTFDHARIADRSRAVAAGGPSLPSGEMDAASAAALLAERREALRVLLRSADGLPLAEVGAPNPVLGPLNGYQWVVFAGAHEGRHAEQIREIGAALAAATPEAPPA